jgi:hypothetical protein
MLSHDVAAKRMESHGSTAWTKRAARTLHTRIGESGAVSNVVAAAAEFQAAVRRAAPEV